jgi:ABC-type dipeptide/oligopeptide/nickel transport system permease subunit
MRSARQTFPPRVPFCGEVLGGMVLLEVTLSFLGLRMQHALISYPYVIFSLSFIWDF